MSETTLNKDDLATQEMIAMLDETETADNNDIDPPQAESDNIEELDSLLDVLEEGGDEEVVEASPEPMEEVDEIMNEEAVTEEALGAEASEEVSVETNEALEEVVPSHEQTPEPETVEKDTQAALETSTELEEVSKEEIVNEEVEPSAELEEITEDEVPLEAEASSISPTNDEAAATPPSSEKVITELESALTLKQETEQLAKKVKEASLQTTNLALEATRVLHEKTHQLQAEIDEAYKAAERARLLLEKAEIEVAQIPSYTETELPAILQEIHEKNESLKKQNEALKSQLG